MRKKLFVVLLTLGLIGGLAPAAEAAYAATAIATCSAWGIYTTGCWSGLKGIASDIEVYELTLNRPGINNDSLHVDSVYIRKDINNFCEFGWQQRRLFFGYGDKDLFVTCVSSGDAALQWTDTMPGSLSNGIYRFQIYQKTATAGVFRFRWNYKPVWNVAPGPWHNLSVVWTATPASGVAFTASEMTGETTCSHFHFNVWIENSSFVWQPANGDYNTHLVQTQDTSSNCDALIYPYGANIGDEVLYS